MSESGAAAADGGDDGSRMEGCTAAAAAVSESGGVGAGGLKEVRWVVVGGLKRRGSVGSVWYVDVAVAEIGGGARCGAAGAAGAAAKRAARGSVLVWMGIVTAAAADAGRGARCGPGVGAGAAAERAARGSMLVWVGTASFELAVSGCGRAVEGCGCGAVTGAAALVLVGVSAGRLGGQVGVWRWSLRTVRCWVARAWWCLVQWPGGARSRAWGPG